MPVKSPHPALPDLCPNVFIIICILHHVLSRVGNSPCPCSCWYEFKIYTSYQVLLLFRIILLSHRAQSHHVLNIAIQNKTCCRSGCYTLHVSALLLSGAIYAEYSEVYIRGDTIFSDNTAEGNGGKVYCFTCDMILTVHSGPIRCDNKTNSTIVWKVRYAGTYYRVSKQMLTKANLE